MKQHENPHKLPAPIVPMAEHDGLLNVEYLSGDVEVRFPLWQSARPGDYYNLQIDSIGLHPPYILSDPLPVEDLTIRVPGAIFADDGVYQLRYAATNHHNDVTELSEAFSIKVDRTAPGAALLAPIMFFDTDHYDIVRGSVPGYAHMAAGDVIQTFCNGVPGPVYQVVPADLTVQVIEIAFSKRFLYGAGSNTLRITYRVTDRAGNQSIESRPAELTGLAPDNVDWTPSGIVSDNAQWIPSGTPSNDTGLTPSGM